MLQLHLYLLFFTTGLFFIPAEVFSKSIDPLLHPGYQQILEPYLVKEFELDGPGTLKAYTFSGNIDVKTHSHSNKVKVEVYVNRGYSYWMGGKNIDNYRLILRQQGNQIISSVERKEKDRGFFSDGITFSYKIYVPSNISADLRTSAGNINAEGLKGTQVIKSSGGHITLKSMSGSLEAFTSGGNINIEQSRGKIYGQTNGGNIDLANNSGDLRFRTNGGQITAEAISGSMLSEVNGGSIKVDFLHVSEGIELKATAGDIYVTLPKEEGFDVSISGLLIDLDSHVVFDGIRENGVMNGRIQQGGLPVNLKAIYGNIALNVQK